MKPNYIQNILLLLFRAITADIRHFRFLKVCLTILLGFHLMSCMPVMMAIYGLHQPKYVSDEEVIKYYNRLGLQDEIYRVKDYTGENRNRLQYLGNSMPEILLFNRHGQLTKFETDCSSSLDSIAGLSTHDIDHLSLQEKSIQDFMNDTYVINTIGNGESISDQMPLYVIKFAEFAGRFNKESVPALVHKLSGRNDVGYIVLNMDYTVEEKAEGRKGGKAVQ